MPNEFINGLKLETKKSQYGEYIKGTINTEDIFNNPINGKYLNFMIFKSKSGNWYAVQSKQQSQGGQSNQNIVSFGKVDEEEIPF